MTTVDDTGDRRDPAHPGYVDSTISPNAANILPPALVERMAALVRDYAALPIEACGTGTVFVDWHHRASNIVAELPDVVGRDLMEARRIACESSRWARGDEAWRNVEEGRSDHIPMVRAALDALARGRQLEREGL